MLALLCSAACAFGASLASVSRLRAVSHALVLDPEQLDRAWSDLRPQRVDQLRAAGAIHEAELLAAVVESSEVDEARALANEVLWELEGRLSWGMNLPAACARISLFGALIALALLLADDARFSTELVDVVAFGGGGTLVAMAVGREASRGALRTRELVDRAVEALMRRRWPKESCDA